jgi:hypothetical protein
LPKRFEQRRQCSLRRSGTFGVPTHSVDHDQQHGLFGSGYRDPILIFFTMSYQTDIGGLDLQ